jgi:hypothetical protein
LVVVESDVVSSRWSQSSGGREVWRDSEFVMSGPTSGGGGRREGGRSVGTVLVDHPRSDLRAPAPRVLPKLVTSSRVASRLTNRPTTASPAIL